MGVLKTIFDLNTVRFRPALQKRIANEMLFDMPYLGADPAFILGATRATALIAAAAVKAGHKRFVVVGGKEVGDEDPRFTKLLVESLQKAGLPLPSDPKMKEYEYGREILRDHFGISSERIFTRGFDDSKNVQQNLRHIKASGYTALDSLEIYTLAGTARRVLGTARREWHNDQKPLAVHNVYPTGINRDNWMNDKASTFYALTEAAKVLPGADGISEYEKRGFCVPVELGKEIARVVQYLNARSIKPVPQP